MKFRFTIQQYQSEAVEAITDVFQGQPYLEEVRFSLDPGSVPFAGQISLFERPELRRIMEKDFDVGFANPPIFLSEEGLLGNVRRVQSRQKIAESASLSHSLGAVDLDVEMETGSGKTYVYIKSMFELNKRYGFSKFIVVVPSIAIREGVKKSFEMTQAHFMEIYGKKARFFIYNSKRLNEIERFSSDNSINVMIINCQAFNAHGEDARRIYDKLDEFQSRRPMDVIAKTRPILILDEPQKMGGEATRQALQRFDPLFSMNFSATHKVRHNLIYVLDALDAYNKKLVKKIRVKGITVRNLRGTNGYLYLEDIVCSGKRPPMAKIEFEVAGAERTARAVRLLKAGDDLYRESKEMEQYRDGFTIAEIDPTGNAVTFLNGEGLQIGSAYGDVSEMDMRRIQIRETIRTHLETEARLFPLGIKTLSLFFIDEVAKYRQYDGSGREINGIYGEIFEEEYARSVREFCERSETPYAAYLQKTFPAQAHKGYFSIDKRGRKIDSSLAKGSDISDDVSAYDLILRDKERLLSFEEPTRFIFSHSALREGWDNPNVFQICTLKHSASDVQRRQEVGRGLRLCVNALGERMDASVPGLDVHDINVLTVVANDSYESFVRGLQEELKESLYERPIHASKDYFEGKRVTVDGEEVPISSRQAIAIYRYLVLNGYLDEDDRPNAEYKTAAEEGRLAPLPPELERIGASVHALIRATYDADALNRYVEDVNRPKITENPLIGENFEKFRELWQLLDRKYAYSVNFDSDELIKESVKAIDERLAVPPLTYTVSTGEQKPQIAAGDVGSGISFRMAKTHTEILRTSADGSVKYDLVGKIAAATSLTRNTVAAILCGISGQKFSIFREQPEAFIQKASALINEKKAEIVVRGIEYRMIEGTFGEEIFLEEKQAGKYDEAYCAEKHIRRYVFTDGYNRLGSVERRFAERADCAEEVCVFAKLPKRFYIPTPVGNFSPDWAVVFYQNAFPQRFCIAETKGDTDPSELRGVEAAKIACARKLFETMTDGAVRFESVTGFDDLIEKLHALA